MARAEQRQRTITIVSTVVTLIAVAAFLTFDRGPIGFAVRDVFGANDRVRPAVQAEGTPGGHFEFTRTQPGSDAPVGWNPCEEIHYEVNPDGAPEEWESLIGSAVDEISERTGLGFTYDGTTDDRDFGDRYSSGQSAPPVLIGFADADEVPDLEGDVAGLGGATAVGLNQRYGYVTGMAVFDTDTFDRLDGRTGGETAMRSIILHELGHVVGLAHVDDRGEIMYGEALARTTFGTGDRKGLAKLGAIACS